MHKKQGRYDVISLRIQLSHQGEPDRLPPDVDLFSGKALEQLTLPQLSFTS